MCIWWIKKNGRQAEQALGRSRGGFSTKIHILVDVLGMPLRFILTGGQRHDVTQTEALIESFQFDYALADAAYDAGSLLKTIVDCNAEPVIPPRSNRVEQREYDKHMYKERTPPGRMFHQQNQVISTNFHSIREISPTLLGIFALGRSVNLASMKCQRNLVRSLEDIIKSTTHIRKIDHDLFKWQVMNSNA